MDKFYSYNPYIDNYENYLAHYGIKRKSGRYPWGSGKRPHQHEASKGFIEEAAALAIWMGLNDAVAVGPIVGEKIAVSKSEKFDGKVCDILNEPHEIDKESGLPLKNKEYTDKEDLAMVNPAFKAYSEFSTHNCANCSIIYELRKKGFDVTANLRDHGLTTPTIASMFKDAEVKTVPKPIRTGENYAKKVLNTLSKEPEGSHGIACVDWYYGGGHAYNYEIKNGKVVFSDGQCNKKGINVKNYLYEIRSGSFEYIRTDDKTPNFENISKQKVVRDTTKSVEEIVNNDIVKDPLISSKKSEDNAKG